MRKHHCALGGVALALVLTLTGCGDDTGPNAQEAPSEMSSPTPTTSTPTSKTPEEKAAAQLTRYLKVRDDFYRSAAVNLEHLNKLATGDEFLLIQAAVEDLDRYDIRVTGQYGHTLSEPRRRTDSMIIITDCEDRAGVVERGKDGKRIKHTDPNGDPLRNPLLVKYSLVEDKGTWKVSKSDIHWDQPC